MHWVGGGPSRARISSGLVCSLSRAVLPIYLPLSRFSHGLISVYTACLFAKSGNTEERGRLLRRDYPHRRRDGSNAWICGLLTGYSPKLRVPGERGTSDLERCGSRFVRTSTLCPKISKSSSLVIYLLTCSHRRKYCVKTVSVVCSGRGAYVSSTSFSLKCR